MTLVRNCAAALLKFYARPPSTPWRPVIVYGLMVLAFVLWNLLGPAPPTWVWVVLPASGLLFWTVVEYVLHSQFFHDPPAGFRWLSISHGSHHESPDDPGLVVVRLSFSFPAAVILFSLSSLILWSAQWAGLFVAGVMVGYAAYEVIHYSIHQVPAVRRVLRPLASHHLHHHFADASRCFGVTTRFWDWVFRTGRRDVADRREPTPAR